MEQNRSIPAWANGNAATRLVYKFFRMLKNQGIKKTAFATRYVISRFFKMRKLSRSFYLTDEERQEQENTAFPYEPVISIIVPLYNTPEKFFRELLDSVRMQSYKKWELCLADGSTDPDSCTLKIGPEEAAKDERIKYSKLDGNYGIAGNTNAAVELSSGDYIGLLDHDDLLSHRALYEVVKAINETGADFLYSDEGVFNDVPTTCLSFHLKPDFSPDYLNCCNYICHFSVIKKDLAVEVGLYDTEFDGSQDYDFTLRVTEKAKKIHHIVMPIYFWREHANSVASDISAKPYAWTAAKKAVEAHFSRTGQKAEVDYSTAVPMLRIKYEIIGDPLVSIIIPTYEHKDVLKRCIDSIYDKSTYPNFEILLIENNSKKPETFAYYEELKAAHDNLRVLTYEAEGGFNFSAINNFGAKHAKGEHLLFLNNDTEVITPTWIEEMLMYTQRKDVGAAGCKLLYPDDRVQHGGIGVGLCGSAANLCPLFDRDYQGYMSRLAVVSNMSACTAACLMVRKDVFDEVGGFLETLAVSWNDVDLCLNIRDKGYLIVFTPIAELYHYESVSRGSDQKGAKYERMMRELEILKKRWPSYYDENGNGDPFYNKHFGRNSISYDA